MLNNERKNEILNIAKEVNSASEKYQLIHATFAIEKILENKIHENYKNQFEDIRKELTKTTDTNQNSILIKKAQELQEGSVQKTRIVVEYIPQLKYGSARISSSASNNFQITLPKEMENTRNDNDKINFDKLKDLRKLMAHELGHIALHSGIIDGLNIACLDDGSDEEADFFAEKLIDLRKNRNEEIYENNHFQNI